MLADYAIQSAPFFVGIDLDAPALVTVIPFAQLATRLIVFDRQKALNSILRTINHAIPALPALENIRRAQDMHG